MKISNNTSFIEEIKNLSSKTKFLLFGFIILIMVIAFTINNVDYKLLKANVLDAGYGYTNQNTKQTFYGYGFCTMTCINNYNNTGFNPYGYTTGNISNDLCKSPDNVLACSLGLDTCPYQCKCSTPETTLACSLGLSSCPSYCTNQSTGTIINTGETIVNTGELPSTGNIITPKQAYWTNWLDRDGPGGNGDYEQYTNFTTPPCKDGFTPIRTEFLTVDGSPITQNVRIDQTKGGRCVNAENTEQCKDYKVRFYCQEL